MEPLTETDLLRWAPRAREEYVHALVQGWQEMQRARLSTPLRLCEFLAQVGHETGGLTIVVEDLRYTVDNLCKVFPSRFGGPAGVLKARLIAGDERKVAGAIYDNRPELGNVEPGDGYDFRGRGLLQDTGRACYREYGRLIATDLEQHPELLENPSISLRVALTRWQRMDLNRYADRHYTRAIGNAINRGSPYSRYEPIGAKSRIDWFLRAWAIFGDGQIPVPPSLALGAYGSDVEVLQRRLKELGYPIGTPDSVFGPVVARAIAAFKLDHKRATNEQLDPDEEVGSVTWSALNNAEPIEHGVERVTATVHDLAAAGSTEVKGGLQQQATGTGLALLGGAGVAQQTGMLDAAQQTVGVLPQWMGLLDPAINVLRWGFSHFFFIAILLLGIWLFNGGAKVVAARLAAHRFGFNLSR